MITAHAIIEKYVPALWVFIGLALTAGCGGVPDTAGPPPSTENMVLIPAGEFLMGSETLGNETERPVHAVFLDDYYIDVYEVSNQDFTEFLNHRGNRKEGGAPWINLAGEGCPIETRDGRFDCPEIYRLHPVCHVTWYGAKAYAEWRGKRLPTEAEWEKASRGGRSQMHFPWGNDPPADRCNWSGIQNYPEGIERLPFREGGALLPVDTYSPNAYGLYNMAGNVSEWCEDWYNKKYYDKSPYRNPLCTTERYYRIHRGGGFSAVEMLLRCSARTGAPPDVGAPMIGFRCVLDAGHEAEKN
jgi:formylglycine-generating enzyme required for sulfatase activity